MDITDLLTQFLQYFLGSLSGNVAGNVVVGVTLVVTLCTLILRFWPEPKAGSKVHWLWSLVHVLASLKVPEKQTAVGLESGQSVNTADQTALAQAGNQDNKTSAKPEPKG